MAMARYSLAFIVVCQANFGMQAFTMKEELAIEYLFDELNLIVCWD